MPELPLVWDRLIKHPPDEQLLLSGELLLVVEDEVLESRPVRVLELRLVPVYLAREEAQHELRVCATHLLSLLVCDRTDDRTAALPLMVLVVLGSRYSAYVAMHRVDLVIRRIHSDYDVPFGVQIGLRLQRVIIVGLVRGCPAKHQQRQ